MGPFSGVRNSSVSESRKASVSTTTSSVDSLAKPEKSSTSGRKKFDIMKFLEPRWPMNPPLTPTNASAPTNPKTSQGYIGYGGPR